MQRIVVLFELGFEPVQQLLGLLGSSRGVGDAVFFLFLSLVAGDSSCLAFLDPSSSRCPRLNCTDWRCSKSQQVSAPSDVSLITESNSGLYCSGDNFDVDPGINLEVVLDGDLLDLVEK